MATKHRGRSDESPAPDPKSPAAGVAVPVFSNELLSEYEIVPPRARGAGGAGFLRQFIRLISSRPGEPLSRAMILEALVDPAGRSPAKNTLDHLLQVAVRVGYIDKRRHKRDGTLAWVAGTALPSEEDMAKHLNGFSGHRRKLSAVSVREADQ